MTYTIGSCCSGFGGLDLAVEAVLGPAKHLWHAEYDPGDPGKNPKGWNPYWKGEILAAHWPGVPNLGDLAAVDWSTVEPVDVLTAGFPCKDISAAGRMAGMGTGRVIPAGHLECGCPWADHQPDRCGDSTAPTTLGASLCNWYPDESIDDEDAARVAAAVAWLNARDLADPDGPPPERTVGGTRSGVWSHIAAGVAALRPRLVVVENVRALLSTDARRTVDGTDRDVEPGPAGLGDGPVGHVLRAAGAVIGDLASLGFDTEWVTVPASDVGAPHRRERVFILAWPADSEGVGHWHRRAPGRQRVASAAVAGGAGGDGVDLLPTPGARLGDDRGSPSAALAADRFESGRRNLDDAVALLPTPVARDGDGRGEGGAAYWDGKRARGWDKGIPLGAAVNLLPTPTARCAEDSQTHRGGARSGELLLTGVAKAHASGLLLTPSSSDAGRVGEAEWAERWAAGETIPETHQRLRTQVLMAGSDQWGRYAPAIARWEQIVGRPAPNPTEPGSKGQPRLSPRFVEWMQGLPAGWVTDHVGRNPALHALGDGVVWRQGAYALRLLLSSAAGTGGKA